MMFGMKLVLGAVTMIALAGLVGCGESAFPRPEVRVEDAWVRAVSGSGANSAAYMRLRNVGGAPDRLVGARADFARMTELHRTTIDESGLARMGEVEGLEVPHGEAVILEPGGYHIMLMGVEPLVEGDTVTLTLVLESSDSVRVRAEVRSH
jgi:copper(I)-binding protein